MVDVPSPQRAFTPPSRPVKESPVSPLMNPSVEPSLPYIIVAVIFNVKVIVKGKVIVKVKVTVIVIAKDIIIVIVNVKAILKGKVAIVIIIVVKVIIIITVQNQR